MKDPTRFQFGIESYVKILFFISDLRLFVNPEERRGYCPRLL